MPPLELAIHALKSALRQQLEAYTSPEKVRVSLLILDIRSLLAYHSNQVSRSNSGILILAQTALVFFSVYQAAWKQMSIGIKALPCDGHSLSSLQFDGSSLFKTTLILTHLSQYTGECHFFLCFFFNFVGYGICQLFILPYRSITIENKSRINRSHKSRINLVKSVT